MGMDPRVSRIDSRLGIDTAAQFQEFLKQIDLAPRQRLLQLL